MSGFNMSQNNQAGKPFAVGLVCGMKVDAENPLYEWLYKGERYHFCSEVCKQLFQREPQKYIPTK